MKMFSKNNFIALVLVLAGIFAAEAVLAAACSSSYNYPGVCDFTISYMDQPAGTVGINHAGLSQCSWTVYSLVSGVWQATKSISPKSCGPSLISETIQLNIGQDCRQTGINTCYISVWSKDSALPTGNATTKDFYLSVQLDSTPPSVGKLYITANQSQQSYPILVQRGVNYTYKADVSDNIKVSRCDFYLSGSNNSAMVVPANCGPSGCVATRSLALNTVANYPNSYALCYDDVNNQGLGPAAQINVVDVTVSLEAIPSSGNTATRFSLVATVGGGMTGLINYKFDCANNGSWEREVYSVASTVYTASNLCQYSAGNHTARVYVERGLGNASATTLIPVVSNDPPNPGFSCDVSLCGAGAIGCIGYQGCIISADNLSTDPNGEEDISSVVWTIRDLDTMQVKDQFICPPTNIICNYTLPSYLYPKTYQVIITVQDQAGHTESYLRNVQLRKDLSADFVCSDIDPAINNTRWKACDDPGFKPAKGSVVYFSDSLSDGLLSTLGLSGKKSVLSEDATKFVKKIWKKDGVAFSSCQSAAGCSNNTPSAVLEGTEITLEVQDDSGRSGNASHEVITQAALPEWEEIIPF